MTAADTDAALLPLQRTWVIWYDEPAAAPPPSGRRDRRPPRPDVKPPAPLKRTGELADVATMWRYLNNIKRPSSIELESNLYVFLRSEGKDVRPTWEDPANKAGGRWLTSIPDPDTADQAWQDLVLMLVGETLDEAGGAVGVVAARRRKYTRLSIWMRDREDAATIMAAGSRFKEALVERMGRSAPGLEFQDHGAGFDDFRHKIA